MVGYLLILAPVLAGELDARGKGVRDSNRRETCLHQAKRKAGGVFAHGDVCAGEAHPSSRGDFFFFPFPVRSRPL